MSAHCSFYSSSLGKKVVVAITGILLFCFVILHLLGNLQIFLGQDTFNHYAAFLQSMPGLLWTARIGLLVIFAAHIATAIRLKAENLAARPERYREQATVQASAASLYMFETGVIVLLFVVMHLLHFTFGILQPQYAHLVDDQGRHDVFTMVIRGFHAPLYAGGYIVCMLLLGTHLSHGIASFFQTLGFFHSRYTTFLRRVSVVLGYGIAFGYLLIPLSVFLGIIRTSGIGV